MDKDIKFTAKQIEILSIIKKGNPDRSLVSVYDILEAVSYPARRDGMLHSIRVLVNAGYVERRDKIYKEGSMVRVFMVTTKALDFV